MTTSRSPSSPRRTLVTTWPPMRARTPTNPIRSVPTWTSATSTSPCAARSAATTRNAAWEGSAATCQATGESEQGHTVLCRPSGRTVTSMRALACASIVLGVRARGDRLDHRRRPVGGQAREQDGGLHLGARDGQLVVARHATGPRGPRSGARQVAPWPSTDAPIARSGTATRSIGRRRSDVVAVEPVHPGDGRHDPAEQSHRRARVAALEDRVGRPEARSAALDGDHPLVEDVCGRAEALDARDGARDVLAVAQPDDRRGPLGERGEQHRAM